MGRDRANHAKCADRSPDEQASAPPSYRAAQAADGTWTIFDVPVFAEHTEERGERALEFSGEWLDAALRQGQTRQAEGYLAPLHVRHHGEGAPVEAAGKFRLTRVGDISHGGTPVRALFADLVGVRPEVYERIRRGELSYRSVEILDVAMPEIDSLALLDDEVPFFRFPLLRVAEDTAPRFPQAPDLAPVVRCARAGQPVLAYSASGRRSAALFRFQTQTVSSENMKTNALMGAAPEVDQTKKMADAGAILQQLMAGLQQLATMLQGGGSAPGPGPAEQPEPAPTPAMQQAATAVGMTRAAAAVEPVADLSRDGELAALKGQVQALTARFAAAEAQQQVDREAAGLAALGFSGDQVNAFRAKATAQGVPAALSFAAGLRAMGAPSDPPTHWTGEIRGEEPDAPEVARFGTQGPNALARAREYHASWKRSGSQVPFGEYYEANTDADAYVAAGHRKD